MRFASGLRLCAPLGTHSRRSKKQGLAIVFAAMLGLSAGPATSKSLYVIADINASPTPVQTYDIQGPPNHLVFQAEVGVPQFASGGVGLAMDTDSATLFVTYEAFNRIQLLDAVTFADLGTTPAPGANNLAGIVADQGLSKVYAVNRNTNDLFVYTFDRIARTLSLDRPSSVNLAGIVESGGLAGGAFGMAIDESRGLLYVGDGTRLVKVYNLADVNDLSLNPIPLVSTVDVSPANQAVQDVAVDTLRNNLFTGNSLTASFGGDAIGRLVKVDLDSSAVSFFDVRLLTGAGLTETVVGVAVDEDTGNVYATTGNQGSGGSDTLLAFDADLNVLKFDLGRLGNPTGIAVPRADVSFNPLNLSKVDNPDPVNSGADLTYTICFDNLTNPGDVNNVLLVDELPLDSNFLSATGGGVFDPIARDVTWTVGTLAAGAAEICFDLVVEVTAPPGSAPLLNRATISSDETADTTKTQLTEVTAGAAVCDTDADGDVDRLDLRTISRARNQPASGPADPRDSDGDGTITLLDVKACIAQCTLARCAIQ